MNESENSIFVSKRWFLMFKVSMDDLIKVLKDFHTLTGFLIVEKSCSLQKMPRIRRAGLRHLRQKRKALHL